MQFSKVEISDFRNLISATLYPSPSLNLITGSNGSGKSSLLEALYYLGTGSSFRTHRLSNIISHGRGCFRLFSQLIERSSSHRIGLQRCKDLNHLTRIDGNDIYRRSDLVQLMPLQVLSPESISLITDGSELRRNFIDWALFHVEHTFHYHLSNYSRALKQRNALIKSGNTSSLSLWDTQLSEHGNAINRLRMNYTNELAKPVSQLMQSLLPDVSIEIGYRSGWSSEHTLLEALSHSRENDLKLRYTTVGAHRGDLVVKSMNNKVSEILSRGQLKLVVIGLKLAQLMLLREAEKLSISPIILIDDMAAELDIEHRKLLLKTLKALSLQIFITTPDVALVDVSGWNEKKVFHVEHGQVKEVV